MADSTPSSSPLLTTKAPEAALSVQLHPLVLLTISDYITRHTSRRQQGPIVGAIIGQQNGRSFTLEHAYEVKVDTQDDGIVALDAPFFTDRLEQYRDVHKVPALDLVGLFMLGSVEGPTEQHRSFVRQAQTLSAQDPVMLLLFHPEQVDGLQGGKLPISLYESVKEPEAQSAEIKFRELAFEVETGEAEMIGVDFVATGAGVATAEAAEETPATSQTPASAPPAESSSSKDTKKGKGKGKAKDDETPATPNGTSSSTSATNYLTAEDEELLASLTAKANAIKMLTNRLNLIRSYLAAQPASYLTDPALPLTTTSETNQTLLRSIQALLSRLPLLAPPSSTIAADNEKQDVQLTALLAALTRSVAEAQTLGSRFNVVAREKASKERGQQFESAGGGRGGRGGRFGFGEESALISSSSADQGGF